MLIRLAQSSHDIETAQRLRHAVFFEERGLAEQSGRDEDAFDAICDHLLVEHERDGLVGCYRLLRQDVASRHQGFYTQDEFEVAPLIARHAGSRFLELGRSCVLKSHRGKPVMELLWQGIWDYVRAHQMDVMFGCASLEGTDVRQHAATLSFLHHHVRAIEEWHAKAQAARAVSMDLLPAEKINPRDAMRDLPPLVKGYLRLGCMIGEDCVIDHAFNTIDVLIILPVSKINPRYFEKFGAPI
jgi:L-ornithine Nalpha-acyltransferase